jgi:hypothetical protein
MPVKVLAGTLCNPFILRAKKDEQIGSLSWSGNPWMSSAASLYA